MNTDENMMFPDSYEDSRERFRGDLSLVQASWPNAALDQYQIDVEDDLSIDWIQADANESRQKLFILTIGQHGAEGIVGSAMIRSNVLLPEPFKPTTPIFAP